MTQVLLRFLVPVDIFSILNEPQSFNLMTGNMLGDYVLTCGTRKTHSMSFVFRLSLRMSAMGIEYLSG